ncbi:M24 family metallopeptidase [Candidatus Bathyarchaeota archaeon]|nr:M24 family metallopeptidase [Candidatus Bathyarchaeota archaeon]
MKEEIINKFNKAVESEGYDALLVFGYDNLQYLTGAYLHYPQTFPDRYMALFWPKGELPTCIIPHEWESSYLNLAWVNKTKSYTEKPGSPSSIVEVVLLLAKNTVRKTGKIGVDVNRIPLNLYSRLEAALEDFQLVPCDDLLRELRRTKTGKELELIEELAAKTDHAIAGQAHHVLVVQASAEMSNTENVRIHAIERELDEVGHHAVAQVVAGTNAQKWWPGAPMYGIGFDRKPKHHEWMRMELVSTVKGYWCNGARMLAMDEMTEEQRADFQKLVMLRETARAKLKPGVKASEVYDAVKAIASEKGITMEPKIALGAGIGVTNYEPPYISGADETVLGPGMVVIFTPVIHGAGGELLMNNDVFVITEDGNKIIGWWKDWREPFICNYTY